MDINQIIRSTSVLKDDNTSLYELLEAFEESQGFEAESKEEQVILKKIDTWFNVKLEDYLGAIVSLSDASKVIGAEKEVYKRRIAETDKRKASIDKVVDFLSGRLKEGIEAKFKGVETKGCLFIETSKGKATIKKKAPKLIQDENDLNKIPAKWLETIETIRPLNKEIKKALESGQTVEGFHLGETKRLEIK
jgi:hypothetical protein